MATVKATANPNRSRGHTKAELEAKLREAYARLRKIDARITDINRRADEALATPKWYPYVTGAGLFGVGVALSVLLS